MEQVRNGKKVRGGKPMSAWKRSVMSMSVAAVLACVGTPAHAGAALCNTNKPNEVDGNGVVCGDKATATGSEAVAVGYDAHATGTRAVAMGNTAQALAANSLSLGAGAVVDAGAIGSIALGAGSRATGSTLRSQSYLTGQTAAAELAIGGRRITGVADGYNNSDAATVGQLKAANVGNDLAVRYAWNDGNKNSVVDPGEVDYTRVLLGVDPATGNKIAGGVALTNVADGSVAVGSKDAVNGGQLKQVEDLAKAGWNVADKAGSTANIGPNGKVTFQSPDANLTVAQTGAKNDGIVEIALAKTLDLGQSGSVTMGGTTVNSSGLAIVNGPSVTTTGINAGSRPIINVTDGANPGDAVNVSQLDVVRKAANAGWNVLDAAGSKANIGPNDDVTFRSADKNLVVSQKGANNHGIIEVELAKTLNLGVGGSVMMGGTLVNSTGLTIASGPSITTGGIDAGAKVITNVAKGVGDTDAVNVSQLESVKKAATAGWNVTDAYRHEVNIGGEGLVTFQSADANLVVSQKGENDAGIVEVALAKNLNLGATGGVTIGATTLDNDGLTIAGGPSVTATGIDAGGSKITNVAAGDVVAGSKEAINGGQLHGVSESVANALGGGSNVLADGSVSLPSYALTQANDIAGGSDPATNVGEGFDKVDAALGVLNSNINDISTGNAGINYFHVNSTLADSVASGGDSIAIGPQALASAGRALALGVDARAIAGASTAVGAEAEARGDGSLALGHAAQASAAASVAIGEGSVASADNSVALGAGAVASEVVGTSGTVINGATYEFAGDAPAGTVSVGSVGNERTITNVAAGRIGADSTDAVNGSQLYATNQAIEAISGIAGNVNDLAVKYDWKDNGDGIATPDEIDYGTITLAGPKGTTIDNVAPGFLDPSSMQAVNGGQLFQSMSQVASMLGGGASMTENGLAAPTYFIQGSVYNDVGSALQALDVTVSLLDGRPYGGTQLAGYTHARDGQYSPTGDGGAGSTALGVGARATGVEDAVAVGENAMVGADHGTAVGQGAAAMAEGSVALGQASVADRANTVSVGSAGNERQITNVADATQGTDAINKRQLDRGVASANSYTDARVNALSDSFELFQGAVDDRLRKQDRRIDRQGAMGSAMMNMAVSAAGVRTPNRVGVGVGFQGGESALSVGYQRAFSDRATLTLGGAVSSDDTSVGVGAGFGW
jgi:autotransporter adhesin